MSQIEATATPRFAVMSSLVLGALSTGCSLQPAAVTTTADPLLHEQMSSDSRYMMKQLAASAGGTRRSHQIDLADPGQYRFVTNRLRAAGKTAENSPYLFERIRQGTATAIARARAGVTASATSQTEWCDSFIVFGDFVASGSTTTFLGTRPVVSCGGGASYVYADITTYNSNASGTENFLVASAAGEDFSGGTNYDDVEISPVLPRDPARVNRTDSFIIADNDAGEQQLTFNSEETSTTVRGSIVLEHPAYHDWLSNGGNIEVCQLRGFNEACDYAVGSVTDGVFTGWTPNSSGIYTGMAAVAPPVPLAPKEPWTWRADPSAYFKFTTPFEADNIYLPTKGVATFVQDDDICVVKTIESAEFWLVKTLSGGTCITKTSFAAGFPRPPFSSPSVAFSTISDFVNNGGVGPNELECEYHKILNDAVNNRIVIQAKVDCGDGEKRVNANTSAGPSRLIKFRNSCFVEGTGIRRADGSTTNVEAITVGDKVTSDLDGTILTVMGVARGGENEPIVDLRDSKGHHLQLTSKHPVVKASGEVVFAAAIVKDDQVMTDRGIASIVSVARIPYGGQVYNLKLGTPDERAAVGRHRTTMFAGGFLVGDSTMQQDLDTPHPPVARLSSAWQRDYQNAVAGNPPMQRTFR